MRTRDIFLALLVVVVWGLNFVAIKWGVEAMPPLLLTGLRYSLAALPAVFFVKRPQVPVTLLIVYGVAIGIMQFGLLFVAIKLGMPAGLASLVIQMQVFFTLGLAVALLGERPGRSQTAGAGIALCGIIVIGLERMGGTALIPLLMTLLAALFWGAGNIVTKKAGRIDMLGFVVWSSLVPPIPLFAASIAIDGFDANWLALVHFNWFLVGVVAFNSLGATLAGFGLWSFLLARYPASMVAPFALLVPVVGIASSVVVLGEPLSGFEIGGSSLVFCGLLVNVFGPRIANRRSGKTAGRTAV